MSDNLENTQSESNPSSETLKTENMIPQSRFNEVNNKYTTLRDELEVGATLSGPALILEDIGTVLRS